MDAHRNLAISTVATAPSPATSGTSLIVASGHGARFPTAPFPVTIWPAASQPDPSNAEVAYCTAVATDTLTLVRAQEGTTARTVVVGDQIAAGITAKVVQDIEQGIQRPIVNPAAVSMVCLPGLAIAGIVSTFAMGANTDFLIPFECADYVTFDRIQLEVTTAAGAGATGRMAIYTADSAWQPVTLVEDFGTVAIDSTGVKTSTPAASTRTLPPGRYLTVYNGSASATFRFHHGSLLSLILKAAMGATSSVAWFTVSRAHGAFGAATAWTAAVNDSSLFVTMFLRVTAVGG